VVDHLGNRSGPEYMDSFCEILRNLDEGRANSELRKHRLTHAMTSLVGLAVRLHHERDTDWTVDRMPEFRTEARRLLDRHRPVLSGYIADIETLTWGGDPDDWFEVSLKRSAVQVIMDEVDRDDDEKPVVERHRIHDVDLDMVETACAMPALSTRVVPRLPPSHWWWRAPDVPQNAISS
jgi:hypothetical protein